MMVGFWPDAEAISQDPHVVAFALLAGHSEDRVLRLSGRRVDKPRHPWRPARRGHCGKSAAARPRGCGSPPPGRLALGPVTRTIELSPPLTARRPAVSAQDVAVTVRDDRVLPLTRGVAYAIVPFLVVAFAVLYPWPDDTGRLFAWRIRPTMTAMMLGSAYLGGAYFFLRAARAAAWHTIKGGFVPVGVFASLMGVTTI